MADLWTIPAGQPPPGVEPNFVDPPTNKGIAEITLSILIVLATIAVAIRFYVQTRVTKNGLSMEDFTLMLALPMNIAYTGIIIWTCEVGIMARHIWDIPLAAELQQTHILLVLNTLPQPITGLVKISLLFFYRRIFHPNRALRHIATFGIVFVSAFYIAFIFLFSFVSANMVVIKLSLFQAAVNVFTDICLLIMPIAGIANLNLSRGRKLVIMGVFSTGIAAIAMSCLTLYWRSTIPSGADPDETWAATSSFTVSLAEIDIGIICACLPVFAPLLPKISQFARSCSRYFQSKGSILFRSSRRNGDTYHQQPDGPYGFAHSDSTQKANDHMESSEMKAKSPRRGVMNWFDRSIMRETATGATDHRSTSDWRDGV
ncbi:hypothetical protein BJ166DRAFT_511198 [Pestalotiopsis sp. NC0098]|nr:hypothetical protein BJ166DRAFT_511198 [Pestalotiopsis sp. NC0098]